MKRIKAMNGYTIYQMTARDEKNGDGIEGEYAVFFSSDVRDFGVKYSTPEWDGIDSLQEAEWLCNDRENVTYAKEAQEASEEPEQQETKSVYLGEFDSFADVARAMCKACDDFVRQAVFGDIPDIKVEQRWSRDDVRRTCIEQNWYTCGDCTAYEKMLDMVERTTPTTENIYRVARDICDHSEYQTISNVMFGLMHDAVLTFYTIDGEEV